ncbi:hypothetical protein FSP39_015092 [Pinctada imbricata]|uniref:Farnesoic acid O-methyl transferase domain-containing protein n=1 Tax=Pinctada imbricata TaxID=66713 RepID=A0AA89C926_PINIB|nr:hypothetical protein FSP39_015092 [Pinctada imbricata]
MDSYGVVPTNTNYVSFKVKAERDGHFGLLETTSTSSELYEVNLGGWWNMKTCLRKMPSSSCREFVHVNEGVLNESAYIELWFTFHTGRIRYGKITNCNNYIEWVDHEDNANPYVINHFAISTYSGVEGTWVFRSNCK